MKNMPKTRTSAQRYNARMDRIWERAMKAKERVVYENAFNEIHKLHENKILKADTKEARVLVLLSQLME